MAGAEPNQVADAQGERATMAVDLSSLAQHGARESGRGASHAPRRGIDLMKSQQALGLWRKAIQRVIIYTHLGGERCTCLIC